jgi:hypothetical protein
VCAAATPGVAFGLGEASLLQMFTYGLCACMVRVASNSVARSTCKRMHRSRLLGSVTMCMHMQVMHKSFVMDSERRGVDSIIILH